MNIDEKILWNVLDDETISFFKKFAEVKQIDIPINQPYNRDLANTISKKDALNNKGFFMLTGILISAISFIAALSISASDIDNKENYSVFTFFGMFTGGLITMIQYISPTTYDDSKAAQKARKIKYENHVNLQNYYRQSFQRLMDIHHQYNNFLDTSPTVDAINKYMKMYCSTNVEKCFFESIVSTRIRKMKEKQERLEAMEALGSIVSIGLQVGEIHQLNQIENSLDNIENILEDFV